MTKKIRVEMEIDVEEYGRRFKVKVTKGMFEEMMQGLISSMSHGLNEAGYKPEDMEGCLNYRVIEEKEYDTTKGHWEHRDPNRKWHECIDLHYDPETDMDLALECDQLGETDDHRFIIDEDGD